jgi:hypothetical protein
MKPHLETLALECRELQSPSERIERLKLISTSPGT